MKNIIWKLPWRKWGSREVLVRRASS